MTACIDLRSGTHTADGLCQKALAASHQPASSCFHCQRCGAGCPVFSAAGTTPNRFLRLVQLGQQENVLANPLLWLCVGCGTCGARCPNRIATNEVIDQIRMLAKTSSVISPEVKDVRALHRMFLNQVRRFGRLHEFFLIAELKIRTRRFFKDLVLGWRMFRRGKIDILPHRLRGIPEVKHLFERRAREGRTD